MAASSHGPKPDGLVVCGKCGARISDEAETCPHCGQPQPIQEWNEREYRLAKCIHCAVSNAVATKCGWFWHESWTCRGCGRSLTECHPEEYFERDMDEAYSHAVVVGRTVGGVAAIALLYLSSSGRLNWDWFGRLFGAWLAYVVAGFFGRWGYGWWVIRSSRKSGNRPITLADWDRASARYASYRQLRNEMHQQVRNQAANNKAASHTVTWLVVAVVLFIGCVLYQSQVSEYAQGRQAGIQRVREANAQGLLARQAMRFLNQTDLIPTDPNKSADWNAGFRAGCQEELIRLYPPPKQ